MTEATKTRLWMAPQAPMVVGQAGLTLRAWAERAGVSYATVRGLKNPASQPDRVGGMRPDTAWKLVRAYAEAAKIDENVAFGRIIEERAE